MRPAALTTFLAIPLFALAGGGESADAKKIQGSWVLNEAQQNGNTQPQVELRKLVWTFDGDTTPRVQDRHSGGHVQAWRG